MVLLNCLPPFPTNMPSAGLSILKSYLEHNKVSVEVAYWNLELSSHLKKRFGLPESTLFPLMIVLLYQLVTMTEANNKVKAYLTSTNPAFFTSDEKIKIAVNFVKNYFRKKLSDYKDCKLFGFSAKHDQWLSSLPCTVLVKELFPETYVVVGGFQRRRAAEYYLDVNPSADFTCWGEGEASLKALWDYRIVDRKYNRERMIDGGKSERKRWEDPCLPLGIVERHGKTSIVGSGKRENVSDFRENHFPDFHDYMDALHRNGEQEIGTVSFPIDGIRGCTWNRCRFCVATEGFHYSERSPESIAREMMHQYKRHGIKRFYFNDDDTGAGSKERLKQLASVVSALEIPGIECTAWINPTGLDMEVFEILKRSGFSCLKTGNEADSDNLLRKMDKKNRFADNILFIKAAERYGIQHQGGLPLITGVPNEAEEDILESIRNLRFLRFYLCENTFHSFNSFDLSRGSRYYLSMSVEERSYYSVSLLGEMLPKRFLKEETGYEFLQFKRTVLRHNFLWRQFQRAHDHYIANKYRYELNLKKANRYEYKEYANDIEIARLELEPIAVGILRCTDDRVVSLSELKRSIAVQAELQQLGPINIVSKQIEEQLIAIIQNLKRGFLLYASVDYSQIISVLDSRSFPTLISTPFNG